MQKLHPSNTSLWSAISAFNALLNVTQNVGEKQIEQPRQSRLAKGIVVQVRVAKDGSRDECFHSN
eukprot:576683-Pelagomonas_calceolata.AAC.1